MGSGQASDEAAEAQAGAILGHVIAKRRFTRWAAWYALIYLCLPLLALGVLVDLLLCFVVTALLGCCTALFCLFG